MNITHLGTFYGVPINLDMTDDEAPTITGRNFVCEWLFRGAVFIHIEVIERAAQLMAAVCDQDYEPGFPLRITETIKNDFIQ